jgi:hypothetical protein
MKWTCTAALVVIFVACGSGDLTLNEADPDIVAQKPSFEQVYLSARVYSLPRRDRRGP